MIRILYDIISTYKVYYIGLNFVRPFQPPVLFVLHFPVLHFPVLHFQSPRNKFVLQGASGEISSPHVLFWDPSISPKPVELGN